MRHVLTASILSTAALLAPSAAAQTPFTYQGELREAGAPANGVYDLRFEVFDAPSGGLPVAVTRCVDNLPVQDGRFTVELDFGGLDAVDLWIEIAVRPDAGLDCSSAAGLTILGARQKITWAPKAAVSRFALDTQLLNGQPGTFYRTASNLLGSLPSSTLTGTYTQPMILNNAANQFAGSGTGLTGLSASNISTGLLSDARLSNNVALYTRSGTFSGLIAFANPATFSAGGTFNGGATFNSGLNVATTSTFTQAATFSGPVVFNGVVTIAPTARVLPLAAQAFHAANSTLSLLADSNAVRGTVAGQGVNLDAPVQLPDGAAVTQLDAFVLDNDAASLISAALVRIPLAGTGFTTMASAATTGPGASPTQQTITDTSVSGAVVDNAQFAYYVRVSWTVPLTPTTINLRGAKITYTITSPLP